MKQLLFIIGFLYFGALGAQTENEKNTKRQPKIGLSLAGGGAKGFAHVGVLKLIDSLGVRIDYISGTSMGAIVGGLYASGYTGKDIEKIVLETDFYSLIANEKTRKETSFFSKTTDKYLLTVPIKKGKINVLPKAISTGQKNIYMLKELFKNVSSVQDFSKLPIPFMCIGTNLESGAMQIFEKGDLVSSIMASSAFPSLMDPVKIGDSLYIDGAMTVNYPSKPLKDKGIDIVIGVDLSQGLASREQLNSAIDILNQVIDFNIQQETKRQYEYTDINIHPNLKGMSATSYGDKQTILKSGYKEALKYADILKELPKRNSKQLRAPLNPIYSNIYKIDTIHVENNEIFGENYILGKMNLTLPSIQTYGNINKMVDKLYATNNYRLISYDIVRTNNRNILKLIVSEDESRFFLKFGLHYDEIFKTGLLLNATAKRVLFRNSIISLDLIVGDKPRYYFNYFIDNGYIPGLGIYASAMTSIDLKDQKYNTKEEWKWYNHRAYLQSTWRDKFAIGGGLSHDYFKKRTVANGKIENFHSLNPYVFIKTDTRDDKDFATKGFFMNAEGTLLDILDKTDQKSIIQVKADARINIPIKGWFTNRIALFGGFSTREYVPDFYQFRLGGIFEQSLNNFIRFEGHGLGQETNKNVLVLKNYFQFRLNKNIFIIPHAGLATMFENFSDKDFFKFKHNTFGITAGYKSPFGQIKIDYSNAINRKGTFSVVLGHWF